MTFAQLRYFVKTAELGSITAAAEYFSVTQPAISNVLHDLAKEYNVTLFAREGRTLFLTDQGRLLYDSSKSLLEHYDNVEHTFRNIHETKSTVRIAMTSNYSYLYLADLYEYLTTRFANLQFEFENVLIRSIISGLQNENLDIAVLSVAVDSLKNYHVHTAKGFRLSFCASDKLFPKEKDSISLAEIAKYPLALHQKGSAHNQSIRDRFEEEGLEPDIRFELNQIGAIRRLVCRGAAATILSSEVFQDDPTVHSCPIDGTGFEFPMFIVHKKENDRIIEVVHAIQTFFKMKE